VDPQHESFDRLWPDLYAQLRRLAEVYLAREAGDSLQPSDLVHEAYLRMKQGANGQDTAVWQSRAHFFNTAAETMHHVLVDSARRRKCEKRGGKFRRLPLLDDRIQPPSDPDLILSIDDVLHSLQAVDPRSADMIRLHYFMGLSIDEVAGALGLSRAHAYRQWHFARAWLYDAMRQGDVSP
jgi:RNA polymerase sigma factor (TIGR02999 family)